MFLGTLIGGMSAAGLGFAFGTGIRDTMAYEVGTYIVVGLIAGFFFGSVAHLLTYRPTENVERSAPAPGLGQGFGSISSGVSGGVLLMVVAALWFFAGIVVANRIYIYPPVMFVIGVLAMIKGSTTSKS